MKASGRARSLGTILTVLLGLQIVVATVAYAHHPIVGGSVACDHVQGKQVITWTVQNSETTSGTNRSMTVVGLSVSSGSVVGLALNDVLPPQPAAGSLVTATTTLPGTQTGNVTLSVTGSWNNGGPQNILATKLVALPGGCLAPPSLHITKTADAPSANATDAIGFTITVSNTGAGPATNVSMSDPLPSQGAQGISWSIAGTTGSPTCGIGLGTLTCTKASLASSSSFSVHVTSATDSTSCGTYDNTATLSASNVEGAIHADASVTVKCASIDISKTADETSVSAGDVIGFKITVTNNGDGDAYGVSMTDTLPTNAGLRWSVADDGGATCNIASGVLTCTKASLAPAANFTVHVTSPTTAAGCGTVDNSASVTTTNDGQDSASASVTVLCPDVSISKTPDSGSVVGGDPIGFTITVSNSGSQGTGTAKDVTVTDTLPANAGLSWAITPPVQGCSISSGVLTCSFGDLGPGASASVHISSPTSSEACGATVNNTAAVTLSNGTGGQDSASVDITCPPLGINLTKGGADFAHVGDTIHYALTVTNGTSEPLLNVVITDPVCDSTPLFAGGDTGLDGILTLGETWTYTCDHVVTANDPDPLPNTAHVTAVDKLQRPTDAQASHSVDILHPSIQIVKTANPLAGSPGDPVTYTYVVTNTSKDTTLYNITVTDDKLGAIGTIASLAPGASKTLTKTTTLPNSAGLLTNVGTATGADHLGKKVSDTDNATVAVVLAVRLPRTGTDLRLPVTAGFAFLGIGFIFAGIARKRHGPIVEEIDGSEM